MKQLLQNSIKWIMGMWPFLAILGSMFLWYGKTQVSNQAVVDSIGVVMKDTRHLKSDMIVVKEYVETSNQDIRILKGENKALKDSHIRTLESKLKDKDEALRYERERNQSLEDILKKKSTWIQ